MEKLCSQLSVHELSGKELGKTIALPELESALANGILQRVDELVAAYSTESFHKQRLQQKELSAAYATSLPKELGRTALAMELESKALTLSTLQQKKLRRLQAFQQDSSTRACDSQLYASTSSPRTSRKQSRALKIRIFPSLFRAIVILMIQSLTLHSLSFLFSISSLNCTSLSFQSRFPNGWAHELAELDDTTLQDELLTTFGDLELVKNELEKTCREEENEKQEEQLQILLWEQELEKHLADKPFLVNQLQKNLLENDEQKKLENQELQEKNFDKSFQKMIFQKLVALMPEKHFALAASSRLLGNEAWEEHREASKEISFDKVGDKELPPELRRAQLDCKDLRSASFRSPCPSNFEENSFEQNTFSTKSFDKSTFAENSFTEETFTQNSFTESSFTASSLTESSFTKNSFAKNGLRKKSFDKTSFSENAFLKNSFSQKSFDKKSFDKQSFDKQTFRRQLRTQQRGGTELPASSFEASSFEKSSFENSSFEKSSFEKSSFTQSSFEESSFTKSSFRTSSFRGSSFEEKSFNNPSFAESSLKASSFNQRSFEESRFSTRSLEESSFTSSFEQSSLQLNSFESSSLEDCSFPRASLDSDSFTRQPSTSELSKLDRSPSTTELAALRLELAELEQRALKKAASSSEPQTSAHLCLQGGSFSLFLGGGGLKTSRRRGGVLRGSFPPYSLHQLTSLTQLVPWLPCLGSSLP